MPADIRFTTKGKTLYAFCMGVPETEVRIVSLGKNSKVSRQKVASVTLLGSNDKLTWKQDPDALVIANPSGNPAGPVTAFKIEFKN